MRGGLRTALPLVGACVVLATVALMHAKVSLPGHRLFPCLFRLCSPAGLPLAARCMPAALVFAGCLIAWRVC